MELDNSLWDVHGVSNAPVRRNGLGEGSLTEIPLRLPCFCLVCIALVTMSGSSDCICI